LGGQGSNEIKLWRLNSRQKNDEMQIIGHHGTIESGIYQVKFSPSGQYVVSASGDGRIILWSAANIIQLKKIAEFEKAHEQNVFGLNFSADERYFVSGSGDQTIKIWNISQILQQGNQYQPEILRGHTSDVTRIEFLGFREKPNSELLIVSSSNDHTIRLWEANRSNHDLNVKPSFEIRDVYSYGCSLLQKFVNPGAINLSFNDSAQKIKSLCGSTN
jgi:WD40 repeat protein